MSDQAFVITGRGELTAIELERHESVAPGHALVSITYCGVCASDVDAYREGYPYPPSLAGHEWGGVVVALGEGETELAAGDRVARTIQPACGHCRMCRRGHHQRCLNLLLSQSENAPSHGAYARELQVPSGGLIKIPSNVTDEQAAMVEPATVALHAVLRCNPRLGDTIVVVGAGIIGLFAVQFAHLSGGINVIAVDPKSDRRDLAVELGATKAYAPDDEDLQAFVLEVTDNRGADLIVDCSGHPSALEVGPALARPGAKYIAVGAPHQPVELHVGLWMMKELDLMTSLAHTREEFDITVALLANGQLRTDGMKLDKVALSELPAVFERLAGGTDSIKTLVDPTR